MCLQRNHLRKKAVGSNTGNDFRLERNYGSASILLRIGEVKARRLGHGGVVRARYREVEVEHYSTEDLFVQRKSIWRGSGSPVGAIK